MANRLKAIARIWLLSGILSMATVAHSAPPMGESERLEIGAYNHLTVAFALLRHGVEAERLREDVLGNVTLNRFPESLQRLYRELLRLSDRVINHQNKLEVEKKNAQLRQAQKDTSKLIAYLGGLASACGVTASAACLAQMISPAFSADASANTQIPDIAFQSDLRTEISEFEFQLSLARSGLLDSGNIAGSQLIQPGDIDQYLMARDETADSTEAGYYKALASLHLRSPAMYFVAYELGTYYAGKKDLEAAARFFRSAVEHTPTGIRRSPVRADAKAYLADIAVHNEDLDQGLTYYSEALNEMPENLHAIAGKATALHMLRRYDAAIPLYKQWLQIAPDDRIGHYNYACTLARNGEKVSTVLLHIKNAFNAGYSDVAYTRSDADLAAVHGSAEFRGLTAINLSFVPDWDAIDYDNLDITNNSGFDLTNVRVLVNYRERNDRGHLRPWATLPAKYEGSTKRLRRQQELHIDAFNSSIPALAELHIRIVSDQGALSVLLYNRRGTLIVEKIAQLN